MLDLKAKLAAAGVVTKEQVEKFDKEQALARDKRRADEEKAAERKAARAKPRQANPNHNKPQHKRGPRPKAPHDKNPSGIDVEALKKLNRGDAYARIRKIVDHSRLDDKERTIPKPDDQIFNFVTSKGKVSRLYLTEETVKSLKDGKSGISSFMSHHGLSHCVLPKEVAVALAEVFPYWLRHLQGFAAAGQIEVPEAVPEEPTKPAPDKPSEPAPDKPSEPAPVWSPGPPQDEPTEPFEIPTREPRTPK